MIGIYKIVSPSERVYIGQSIDIERRFKKYENLLNCKTQTKLYRSFIKYGVDNHKFSVILECSTENLNLMEREIQEMYNVIGENGLNCMLTSTDDKSGKLSNETKEKLSKMRLGIPKSEESKRKMSIAMKGNKNGLGNKSGLGKEHSDEHKLKISLALKGNTNCLGNKASDETKLKMSEARKGLKRSEETKLKMSIAQKLYSTNKKLL